MVLAYLMQLIGPREHSMLGKIMDPGNDLGLISALNYIILK